MPTATQQPTAIQRGFRGSTSRAGHRRTRNIRQGTQAAAAILASIFGDDTPVIATSDVRPGTRPFPSFSAITGEIADARVFGGIHFRISCLRGNALGQAVAAYVSSHATRD